MKYTHAGTYVHVIILLVHTGFYLTKAPIRSHCTQSKTYKLKYTISHKCTTLPNVDKYTYSYPYTPVSI